MTKFYKNREKTNIKEGTADRCFPTDFDDFFISAETMENVEKIIERTKMENIFIGDYDVLRKIILGAVFVFDLDLVNWERSGEIAFMYDLVGIEMNADIRKFPYVDFGPDYRPRFARN